MISLAFQYKTMCVGVHVPWSAITTNVDQRRL